MTTMSKLKAILPCIFGDKNISKKKKQRPSLPTRLELNVVESTDDQNRARQTNRYEYDISAGSSVKVPLQSDGAADGAEALSDANDSLYENRPADFKKLSPNNSQTPTPQPSPRLSHSPRAFREPIPVPREHPTESLERKTSPRRPSSPDNSPKVTPNPNQQRLGENIGSELVQKSASDALSFDLSVAIPSSGMPDSGKPGYWDMSGGKPKESHLIGLSPNGISSSLNHKVPTPSLIGDKKALGYVTILADGEQERSSASENSYYNIVKKDPSDGVYYKNVFTNSQPARPAKAVNEESPYY